MVFNPIFFDNATNGNELNFFARPNKINETNHYLFANILNVYVSDTTTPNGMMPKTVTRSNENKEITLSELLSKLKIAQPETEKQGIFSAKMSKADFENFINSLSQFSGWKISPEKITDMLGKTEQAAVILGDDENLAIVVLQQSKQDIKLTAFESERDDKGAEKLASVIRNLFTDTKQTQKVAHVESEGNKVIKIFSFDAERNPVKINEFDKEAWESFGDKKISDKQFITKNEIEQVEKAKELLGGLVELAEALPKTFDGNKTLNKINELNADENKLKRSLENGELQKLLTELGTEIGKAQAKTNAVMQGIKNQISKSENGEQFEKVVAKVKADIESFISPQVASEFSKIGAVSSDKTLEGFDEKEIKKVLSDINKDIKKTFARMFKRVNDTTEKIAEIGNAVAKSKPAELSQTATNKSFVVSAYTVTKKNEKNLTNIGKELNELTTRLSARANESSKPISEIADFATSGKATTTTYSRIPANNVTKSGAQPPQKEAKDVSANGKRIFVAQDEAANAQNEKIVSIKNSVTELVNILKENGSEKEIPEQLLSAVNEKSDGAKVSVKNLEQSLKSLKLNSENKTNETLSELVSAKEKAISLLNEAGKNSTAEFANKNFDKDINSAIEKIEKLINSYAADNDNENVKLTETVKETGRKLNELFTKPVSRKNVSARKDKIVTEIKRVLTFAKEELPKEDFADKLSELDTRAAQLSAKKNRISLGEFIRETKTVYEQVLGKLAPRSQAGKTATAPNMNVNRQEKENSTGRDVAVRSIVASEIKKTGDAVVSQLQNVKRELEKLRDFTADKSAPIKKEEFAAEIKKAFEKATTAISRHSEKVIKHTDALIADVRKSVASSVTKETKSSHDARLATSGKTERNENVSASFVGKERLHANEKQSEFYTGKHSTETKTEILKNSASNDFRNLSELSKIARYEKPFTHLGEHATKETAMKLPKVHVDNVVKHLADFIQKQERNSIEFQLNPEHLGKVKVALDLIDNVVKAHISVDTQNAKVLIENNLNELQSQLAKSGIQFGEVSIGLNQNWQKHERNSRASFKQGKRVTKVNDAGDVAEHGEVERSEPRLFGYNTYEFLA